MGNVTVLGVPGTVSNVTLNGQAVGDGSWSYDGVARKLSVAGLNNLTASGTYNAGAYLPPHALNFFRFRQVLTLCRVDVELECGEWRDWIVWLWSWVWSWVWLEWFRRIFYFGSWWCSDFLSKESVGFVCGSGGSVVGVSVSSVRRHVPKKHENGYWHE